MQFRFQSCRVSKYILLCFLAWTACGPSNSLPAFSDARGRLSLDDREDQMDSPIDPLRPDELIDVALWGVDHRKDLFEPGIPLDDADGVVALFDSSKVRDLGNGRSSLDTATLASKFPLPLCAGEQFGQQPSGSICSGFLVTPNTIATAGHCVHETDVQMTKVVFGFRMQDAVTPQSFEIPNSQIYRGVSIIGRQYITDIASPRYGEDWTLFRLDRPVPDHRVLPVRRAGRVANGQEVHSIGHPMGLPAKFIGAGSVYHNDRDVFFTTNLDAFSGSSGSPVFNASTHEVEGIVVRRDPPDYFSQSGCYQAKLCTEASCRGTEATRTTTFTDLIRPAERARVAVGDRHSCALSNSGLVKCWGANQCGQLGDDTRVPSTHPTDVRNAEIHDIDQIGAGYYHTCVRRHDGAVYCWGSYAGQIYSPWNPLARDTCQGTSSSHPTPVLAGAVDLVVTHVGACAKLADGSAKCWQYGPQGYTQWTAEPSLSDARWIDGTEICAQRGDDVIRCGPQAVDAALTDSIRLSSYADGVCGLTGDGTVRCRPGASPWPPTPPNQSLLDQLGDTVDLKFSEPEQYCYLTLCEVGVICEACDFVGSNMQALVVLRDGSVRSGEIERLQGPHTYQVPPLSPALSGTKQLAASNGIPTFGFAGAVEQIPVFLHHACVLISDGVGKCWGNNSNGQLGNGNTVSTMSPVSVTW